jgi:predicted O-methyltransferase YrrM
MRTAKTYTGEAYHQTETDVDTLQELVKDLPVDPTIINIGASFGTSALAMLEARPDAYIFSIDIAEYPQERQHIEEAGLDSNRVIRILRRSQEVGKHWPWWVEMVFVDGGHGKEAVEGDIDAWLDKVQPGGIIAFHDYGQPSLPHVKAVVDEKMKGYEVVLHVDTIKAFRA